MPKQRRIYSATITGLGVITAFASAGAQQGDVRLEPPSIQALEIMGKHLREMQKFSIRAQTSVEVVLDTDQKLEVGGEVTYRVEQPDKLRIDLQTDVVTSEFIYNGKTFVYSSPKDNSYVQVSAPATIKETLEEAAQKYHLTFPLADLFAWGTPDAPIGDIVEGFKVGTATINGKLTDHWAYRTYDQDIEVWIAQSEDPLPLKVSLVDRDDLARPRMTAVLNWNKQPDILPSIFVFEPPSKAQKLRFLEEGDQQ